PQGGGSPGHQGVGDHLDQLGGDADYGPQHACYEEAGNSAERAVGQYVDRQGAERAGDGHSEGETPAVDGDESDRGIGFHRVAWPLAAMWFAACSAKVAERASPPR